MIHFNQENSLKKIFKPYQNKIFLIKIALFQVISLLLFSLLVLKLFQLQIVNAKRYKSMALNNKQHLLNIPAYRGEIYVDNGKQKITENQPSFGIYMIPYQLKKAYRNPKKRREFVEKLSKEFDINTNNIYKIFSKRKFNPYKSYLIKKDVPFEKITYLAENLDQYPGCLYIGGSKRYYLQGNKYAHIIGYIRKINSRQLREKYYLGYHADSMIGNSGLEGFYDFELRGKDGYKVQIVDVRNRIKKEISPPDSKTIPGNNLYLTIDSRIQNIVYNTLKGYTGAAIVSRVATGEILAMYSYPSYDPNIFIGEVNEKTFNKYLKNPNKPFLNRITQAEYPPSSLFKIIVSIAALSLNKVNFKNDYETCHGGLFIGTQYFKCEGFHLRQNMLNALANSCNVYYYKTGVKIGPEKMMNFSKEYFNLGRQTGIDLPYEKKGHVPTQRWKIEKKGVLWWDGDTANLSIGQGFLSSTPLQMNTLISAIANNGIAYKPHLLSKYRSAETKKDIFIYQKQPIIKLPLSQKKIEQIQQSLRKVVLKGTARKGSASKLRIAGKTGTAQNIKEQSHSWFTCYAPYGSEKKEDVLAVTVLIENGGHGAEAAAPFATAILEGIFFYANPLTTYRRIMQTWTTKKAIYNQWLKKKGLKRLPDNFFKPEEEEEEEEENNQKKIFDTKIKKQEKKELPLKKENL